MLSIETLKNWGADTDEGLTRCFGNADFYLRLVKMIPEEKSFENLRKAIEEGDLDAGFEAAHALKGVVANLSLTPLFTPASEITEHLRSREQMDYHPLFEEVLEKKKELEEIIASE